MHAEDRGSSSLDGQVFFEQGAITPDLLVASEHPQDIPQGAVIRGDDRLAGLAFQLIDDVDGVPVSTSQEDRLCFGTIGLSERSYAVFELSSPTSLLSMTSRAS